MNRYKIVEKMFEMLGVAVDGKEVWEILEDTINTNGYEDGYHNVELKKIGGNLCFAGVDIKTNFDEEDDTYIKDIKLLSIQNDKKTIYIEDVEI